MILAFLDWRTVVREVYVVEAIQVVLGLFLFVYWVMLPPETKVNNFQIFLACSSICFIAGIITCVLMLVQWILKWPASVSFLDVWVGFIALGTATLCGVILRANYSGIATVTALERGIWMLCGVIGLICAWHYIRDPRRQLPQ